MNIKEIREAAESGQVTAMDALGHYFLDANNYLEAWDWFGKAAEQGYIPSMVHAALLGPLVSMSTLKAIGVNEKTLLDWLNTYKYTLKS